MIPADPYRNLGPASILRADARALPLADNSVDLIVTSPPYFALRSYQDGCPDCDNTGRAKRPDSHGMKVCPECGNVANRKRCNRCDTSMKWPNRAEQYTEDACPTCQGTGKGHYAGQLGSEATPAEFVDALINCTREMVRVVKPSGSIWINLGDKYQSTAPGTFNAARDVVAAGGRESEGGKQRGQFRPDMGVRPKSLAGIPWRYALRCIDTTQGIPPSIVRDMVAAVHNGTLDPAACEDIITEYEAGGRNAGLGLILRAEVIWSKSNGLPESVQDRVRRSHEQWFMFTLQPRYYSAVDEIREEHEHRRRDSWDRRQPAVNGIRPEGNVDARVGNNPLGKLPGSVWTTNDSGDSLVRSVLRAVSAGALTIDEGERILWTANVSCAMWNGPTLAAGSGADGETPADTGRQAASTDQARTGRTEWPTAYSSVPSVTGSPSTTSAATSDASTLSTSKPSLSERTSGAPSQSELTAHTDTPSPTPTSTGPPRGSLTRNAAHALSQESDAGESVWRVPTEPLRVPPELGIDHFAAFPSELPKRIIRGWSPAGVCTACGEGRRPGVVASEPVNVWAQDDGGKAARALDVEKGQRPLLGARNGVRFEYDRTITGYACACTPYTDHPGRGGSGPSHAAALAGGDYYRADEDVTGWGTSSLTNRPRTGPRREYHFDRWTPAPTTPSLILDPFGGTGTVAMVARALGRHGIHADLSADYNRLARWRITDLDQLAAVQGHERTKREPDTSDDLLTLLDDGGAA